MLAPDEIEKHLGAIQAHPYLGPQPLPPERDVNVSEDQLGEIFSLLRRVSGVDFRQYKPPTVRRRLLRRMALHRIIDSGAYVRALRENPKEVQALYQDLLIHVTRFFREPESCPALAGEEYPEILEARSEQAPLRHWVPG